MFGGFADVPWHKNDAFIQGEGKSFLFSLTKGTKHECIKKDKEIYGRNNCGVIFGGGFDLCVFN